MHIRGQWTGTALLAAAGFVGCLSCGMADDTRPEKPPAAGPLAKVVDQLGKLGLQADADKNLELSPAEQTAMLNTVSARYGQVWADRVKLFLATADANHDGIIQTGEWKRALARFKPSQPGPDAAETVMVAMSDGVHLATDVYRPQGPGPFPVVFTRTPYNRRKAQAAAGSQTRAGYVLVAQDMRGRFGSEGENLPFVGCGWGEHKDGVESLAWILKQPWCNGKVCTVGGSAGGITQNLLAGAAPPGLTAQHIVVAPASMYQQATYIGGALRLSQVENWTRTNQFDARALTIIEDHPTYDDYWRGQDSSLKFAVMNAPAIHVGGWFDTFSQGTLDSFVGRQHHGAAGARGTQKLVMGPWTHAVGRNEADAELVFPNPQAPQEYSSARWLEYYLKGVDNGVTALPAVTYYVLGDTSDPKSKAPGNRWRQADDWPVPSRATPYYLLRGGKLAASKPAAGAEPVEYTFDPADPCPTHGGNNLTIARGPRNQNPIESRADVVLFTSEPLAEPLEVTGHVTAKVFVASSAVDTDLSIRLCDVYPDGESYNMAEGMLRLRYRNSFAKPEPLTPGEMVEVSVDCWSTSIIFNRGHRLRAAVTSSNYPRFDLNPGTGKPWKDGDPHVKQTNRIFCDAAHPSALILPVVAGAAKN
ncbi:MAG TPA: CocE/NonD family hydrolase [Pirellulales bacterium]